MKFMLETFGSITDLASGEVRDAAWLSDAVNRRAGALARAGVRHGAYVVIVHGNSASIFADLFAVWSAGACAVCVNPTVTAPELANLVDFISPAAVLTGAGGAAADGLSMPVMCLETEASRSFEPAPARPNGALDDPALILFTSGTTGTPKGVVHSFRALLARTALNRAYIGQAALRRALCILPTHFGHGLIGNCLSPLFAGGDLLLQPADALKAAASLGAVLAECDVTFMSSVPAFWRLALKVGRPPAKATLRQVNVGSAPLSGQLWREIAAWSGAEQVANMYGITETANWFAGASNLSQTPEDGLIGTPWGGRAVLLSADGTISATGEGELLLQSPSLMQGYLARPELTAEVLCQGWYRSGDAGSIDGAGVLRLLGRRRDEINRAGVKIHPEEIDLLLERHPAVAEACTFGIDDPIGGEAVAIAVRLADGAEADPAALRAWCGERLKAESVPERWFTVDEMPRSERGKVNRDRVRDMCLATPPRTGAAAATGSASQSSAGS